MLILNLGCGKKLMPDAINVDVMDYPGVDKVADLSKFPWPCKDNRVDGLHVSHLVEHFPNQKQFIAECHRILKPGGFLRIVAPHASCITSVGCLGHFRTYSYGTFHDYLCKPFYMFKEPLFKTTEQKLNWWYEAIDMEGNLSKWMIPIIWSLNWLFTGWARCCPRIVENTIAPILQYREVIWEGRKL